MITFKQFLIESRSAPLYHGTYISNLKTILVDKQGIFPKTFHESSSLMMSDGVTDIYYGVSLSRNLIFASEYRGESAVLEFDQRRLNQNFKIVPIQFWMNKLRTSPARPKERLFNKPARARNEYEEFVITNKAIPVKYITRLYIPLKYKDMDVIRQISDQYGSSFIRILR